MKKSEFHKHFIALSTLIATSGISGCDQIKKLDDMHDSTVGIGKTTEQMNQQMQQTNAKIAEQVEISQRLEKSTQALAKMTDDLMKTSRAMYQDMRQGNSLTIRSERIQEMERVTTMPAKIAEAGKYMMSFEFQLHKSFGNDDNSRMDDLKEQALQEIFYQVGAYATDLEKLDPSTSDAPLQNLFALAVTLHEVNPNEYRLAKENGQSAVSPLKLLEEALNTRLAVERGEQETKRWYHPVFVNEGYAIYLLRLRANMIAAMALDKLTGITQLSFLTKSRMALFDYDQDLKKFNVTQLNEYTRWLNESVRVQEVLRNLGQETKMDSNLIKVWGHMKLVKTRIDSATTPIDRVHAQAESNLETAINSFLGKQNLK